jgi:hypothetical protein
VRAGEGLRHRHRRGDGGIVYAHGTPAIWIVVVPVGVTVLLRFHNPPCS